jgi:hypothetical protein
VALAANEVIRGGVVRDTTTGWIVTTTNQAGATMQGGLLRDPDRRIVVVSV